MLGFHLYEVPWIVEFRDRKSSGRCQGAGASGNEELFNVFRVSVLQDDKNSADWLPNNVNVLNNIELHT